ncbi:zinc ribbon domain-containing protein [Candidatus Bipolaricaulota bacterium]|nr:zinc ribbon domain-containing protein [Candidatus Bipolaricaulota bacterium]
MKCGKCGADNPDYAIYCGKCGNDLPKASPSALRTQESDSTPTAAPQPSAQWAKTETKFCSKCGKEISASSYTCEFCGQRPWSDDASKWEHLYDTPHSYSSSDAYSTYEAPTSVSHSNGPVIGGIFAILAGILALGQGLIYMAGSAMIDLPGTGALCMCGGVDFIFGIASVIGGALALKRVNYGIAILGAILGMLGLGLYIGFLFGLIALIFIAISREEFD